MEKLESLRKSEIIKIGERLELNVQKTSRKDELVTKITEHMVDEDVFEDTILEELPREIAKMTPEQVELEKARIQARMESERNRMELEKARIEQETRLREIDGEKRTRRKPWQFRSGEASEASPKIWRSQRWWILRAFWANGTQPRMAKRMLVNVTPDCTDGKSPESICNSADGKLRRLWIGESGDSQKLRVGSRSL